jgi:dihydroorotate dehydrogenase (NAD+) catalytic subunit
VIDPLVVQPVANPESLASAHAQAPQPEALPDVKPAPATPALPIIPVKTPAPKPKRPDPRPDMSVSLCGVDLVSPVIAASGTFGYGVEFEEIVSLNKIGAFVTKGLSREPMAGNPAPRVIETASGMMNAIGLQNMGVKAFLEQKLPRLRQIPGAVVIANVFGFTVRDCCAVIEALNDAPGIALYELNASCPNTKHGGMVFGTDVHSLDDLVRSVSRISGRPLIVKLSPNVTSIARMAHVAQEAGADAVSLVNTFLSLAIDVETRRPRIANVTGGLSGPAIKPIAVRMVHEVAQAVSIPILGMGGILRAEDAVEFLLAGASAVQVGTASYADPRAVENIATGLKRWCASHDVAKVTDLTSGLIL